MEREEAISLLRGGHEGVAEWNRRREAGEPIPDLSGADLSGAPHGGGETRMRASGQCRFCTRPISAEPI